jgi:predicted permease
MWLAECSAHAVALFTSIPRKLMNTFYLDIKLVLRQLRKSPGFAATAILMLAFGIGATTAIFSIVEGVLLRPLPFAHPEKLVVLGDHLEGTNWGENSPAPVTAPEIRTYARETGAFESLGAYGSSAYELSGVGEPAQINAARLNAGVLRTLGVAPLLGRAFTPQEDEQGQLVAMLSYATWKSRFQGNPQVIGTKILLDRKPYLVIGVMPKGFEFPLVPGQLNRSELWVPLSLTQQELVQGAASWGFFMVGRLKPGISPIQAQSDADRVALEIMRNFPANMASLRIRAVVHPLQQITVQQAGPLVRTLFLAVAVVLLIACANLAGLLLVRAIRRQREIAVRLALGATAGALLRQIMLESLLLSVTGGLLGTGLAAVALRVGKNFLPETLPRIDEIGLHWTVVGFALSLAVLTGLLCGMVPAFAALRTNVNSWLKEGGRSGSAGGNHSSLRAALVVGEIAVALVLLAASGLLLRSFTKMSAVDLGFRPDHVTTAAYALPRKQYSTQAAVDGFNHELLRRLQQLPGAEVAGLTSTLPASGANDLSGFVVEGYINPKGGGVTAAPPSFVVGGYFRAIGIPLMRGRFFNDSDRAGTQLVVMVNRKFAERYWPGQDPIGKRMRIGIQEMQTPWMTVVGEVADVKLGSPDADAPEQYYEPVEQLEAALGSMGSSADLNGNGGYIVLRSAVPPEQMENAIRAIVRSMDPQLALTQVQTMERVVSDSEASRRFNTALITSFALAAILLAVLGIYSVIAFSVAARVQEMAIRMALGSQRVGIMRLIVLSGAKLAVIGCAIGLAASAAASGLLRSSLYGVSPFDPFVLTAAATAVLLLAVAASALPALRAASIDPMQALRGD